VEGPLRAPLGSVGRMCSARGRSASCSAELTSLNLSHACVIGSDTPRAATQLAEVAAVLGERHAHTWPGCAQYIYPDAVAEAEQQLTAAGADCVVAQVHKR